MISLLLLLAIPLIGSVVVLILRRVVNDLIEYVAEAFVLLTVAIFLLSLLIGFSSFTLPVLPLINFNMALSLNGISLPFLLIAVLVPIFALLPARREIKEGKSTFYSLFLLIYAMIIGIFISSDILLLFIFLEITLVSMFFLIYLFGEKEKRAKASVDFLIFTQLGSLAILAAFALLFSSIGSFALSSISSSHISFFDSIIILSLMVFAAMIESPVFPLHVWIADAYDSSPTPVVILLSALVSRLGLYFLLLIGFLSLSSTFTMFQPLMWIGVLSVFYLAFVAMAQSRFKRMAIYSSALYASLAFIGVMSGNPTAIYGSIFLMVSYSFITSAVFLMAGDLKSLNGTDDMTFIHGLLSSSPYLSFFLFVFLLASLGLPGFSNFIGEFVTLLGIYLVSPWFLVTLAALLIVTAFYLNALKRMAFGRPIKGIRDITGMEIINLSFLVFIIVLLGILPSLLFSLVGLGI
ncbi:MAG: NADH-quinone oxidoreductase subunit M [Nanoarchaeota archaeon]|nr:NADH-quinone oxidoreductase subunit M [Nanoarchaeota archaeon]